MKKQQGSWKEKMEVMEELGRTDKLNRRERLRRIDESLRTSGLEALGYDFGSFERNKERYSE